MTHRLGRTMAIVIVNGAQGTRSENPGFPEHGLDPELIIRMGNRVVKSKGFTTLEEIAMSKYLSLTPEHVKHHKEVTKPVLVMARMTAICHSLALYQLINQEHDRETALYILNRLGEQVWSPYDMKSVSLLQKFAEKNNDPVVRKKAIQVAGSIEARKEEVGVIGLPAPR